MEDTDRRDIQACLAGDGDAFARLVERYEPRIAELMWRFSRRPRECEELIQDVFVEAYFALAGYRGEAPLLHWLRRIATRVGYRFWQKREKRKRHVPLDGIESLAGREDPPDPSAAAEILDNLLGRLKPDDRLVLMLHYFEGCSIREIAERTGWNEGVVKMRAHRARGKLRDIARRERLVEKIRWTS